MSENAKPQHLLFKASIALGLLLGVLLLVDRVATYRYVRTNMVRNEAKYEADRRVQSLIASARLSGYRDAAAFFPLLDEIVKGAPQQYAWVRVLRLDGATITQAGRTESAPSYKPGELDEIIQDRDRQPEIRQTPFGPVLVVLNPVRIGAAPMPGPGHPMEVGAIEVGIYTESVSVRFGTLRRNLIIGTTSAFALLGAVILIGLRFRHYLRHKQVEEQLAMARLVQFDLLPSGSLLTHDLEFAARCVPAWQVGGDFYDAFETDDHQIALVLGDVSGKGLSAALLMGVLQGVVHASNGTGTPENHERAMERLNQLLCVKTARERFVSLLWCYFDPVRSVLSYINAGHLPPLLIRKTGQGNFEVHRLDEGGGPVLGLLPHACYEQVRISILPGDLLVVFSDGILEAANVRDEEFGEDRILAAIEENWAGSPTEICDAVLAKVRAFLVKELPHDDQTLMVVRLQKVPTATRPLEGVTTGEITTGEILAR
ncbi:MAG: PP2C family protein-serine/threonine phosphatase [Bryobacteraceae bacterium]|jgi:serine phosphatase RsbU (regulator of sigma subunit)